MNDACVFPIYNIIPCVLFPSILPKWKRYALMKRATYRNLNLYLPVHAYVFYWNIDCIFYFIVIWPWSPLQSQLLFFGGKIFQLLVGVLLSVSREGGFPRRRRGSRARRGRRWGEEGAVLAVGRGRLGRVRGRAGHSRHGAPLPGNPRRMGEHHWTTALRSDKV